ncbi:hypothetical protein KC19_VG312400 [Ceratodon purpureus]|uniref:Secreted protein n=1 Tax=Ceratodon purpureus TaxID=3225 RepID=A0A8T0HW76_CERPU|nr:hypothetical protein KC19_VG312400 [Ceratodon purpureus]
MHILIVRGCLVELPIAAWLCATTPHDDHISCPHPMRDTPPESGLELDLLFADLNHVSTFSGLYF